MMGFVDETMLPWIKGVVTGDRPPVVPVIPLRGVIGSMGPMRQGLTLEALAPVLDSAFKVKRAETVALIINSPGGSPVQSAMIAQRIRQLAEENNVCVIAFCEDVAASGGYWLACAADEIVVDENSIVGSIGVISSSFGFTEAIGKLGIERRLYTAGENKSFLDPFLPERAQDVKRLKDVQADMHQSFKEYVTQRRGAKLKDDPEIFSGAFWTGKRALALGLVDQFGDLRGLMRQRYGKTVKLPVFKRRQGWLARRFGNSEVMQLVGAVEERLIWDRYRL
jgi:serine protease SohB